jgi:hypothetical protein
MDQKTVDRRVKEAAREATQRVEESSTKAVEGFRNWHAKILSVTQANVNAMFEYAQEALKAKSVPELLEISSTHSRRQMEMMAEQVREITGAAQKATIEGARPLAGGITNPFGQMS